MHECIATIPDTTTLLAELDTPSNMRWPCNSKTSSCVAPNLPRARIPAGVRSSVAARTMAQHLRWSDSRVREETDGDGAHIWRDILHAHATLRAQGAGSSPCMARCSQTEGDEL